MAAPFGKVAGPAPIATSVVFAGNVVALLPIILAQIQAMLAGAFGLGALKADLLAQFNAAISISVSFTDPLASLKAAIAGSLQVIANLQAALAAGIPPIGFQVSAAVTLVAQLQAKIGGINLLIDAALGIRLQGVNLLAQLQAALGLGNVVLYAWSGQTMAQAQAQMSAYPFAADGLDPGPTYGVLFVTATPGASGSFQFLFHPSLPA